MSSQQLDLLPTEIIRRIFISGPCLNALTLRSVSQRLNTICNDPSLYVSIIENSNGYISTDVCAIRKAIPGLESLRKQADWRVCAKYALADMYLVRYLSESNDIHIDLTSLCRSVWKWLPELIAMGHKKATVAGVSIIRAPVLNYFLSQVEQEVDDVFAGSTNREHYNEIAIRLIFIGVCDSFQAPVSENPRFGTTRRVREARKQLIQYFSAPVAFLIVAYLPMLQRQYSVGDSLFSSYTPTMDQTNAMSTWLSVAEQQLHWSRCMMLCIVMSAVFYDCIQRSQRSGIGAFVSDIKFDAYFGLPPTPADVPFHELYDTVPPFTPPDFAMGSNGFATRHLPKMTSAPFLEDGLWCGYCFNERADDIELITIHDLSFNVTSDFADHCTIEGQCERLMNSCMILTGTLFKRSGWAQLNVIADVAKPTGIVDSWSVIVTPLGIIGSWQLGNLASSPAGWLWLWKKSWQPIRTEPIWREPMNPAVHSAG